MACSVMRQALRTAGIWSTVLTSLAGPTTCAASDGGPAGNSRPAARRIAPVSSSTATEAPAGTRSASTVGEMLDALVEFEVQRTVHVVGGHL